MSEGGPSELRSHGSIIDQKGRKKEKVTCDSDCFKKAKSSAVLFTNGVKIFLFQMCFKEKY